MASREHYTSFGCEGAAEIRIPSRSLWLMFTLLSMAGLDPGDIAMAAKVDTFCHHYR
jgi:hypothetical protein